MTVSFHKYNGDFFPGTGRLNDNGNGIGKHFCLNIPLEDGIDDQSYLDLFKTIIDETVKKFRPTSIVLQCGADSLGCDRLGAFNLSIAAHGECVNFVKKFDLPLLILGGGGYTIHNVSRCWTYETSILVGATIPDELPMTSYDSFFSPDYKLHPKIVTKVENQNTAASLQKISASVLDKLRYLQGAPSVQMQEFPPNLATWLEEEELNWDELDEEEVGTGRSGERRSDPHDARNEYFDSEDDVEKDDEVFTTPTKKVAANTTARAGRRRGGGRAGAGDGGGSRRKRTAQATSSRNSAAAQKQAADVEEEEEEEEVKEEPVKVETVKKRGRGRPGRPRGSRTGRGRGRGGGDDKGDGDDDIEVDGVT